MLLAPPLGYLGFLLNSLFFGLGSRMLPWVLAQAGASLLISVAMLSARWKPATFVALSVLLGFFMLIYLIISFQMAHLPRYIGP